MTHSGFCILVKEKGAKRSYRLGGRGCVVNKIHASRFLTRESAQQLCDQLAPDNPELEFRVSKF